MPTLFLIPTVLSDGGHGHIPPLTAQVIEGCRHFIVERIRTARRFIRALSKDYPLDEAHFIEISKHQKSKAYDDIKSLFEGGHDICLMSEAGTPCIADPGGGVVSLARKGGYLIRPLSGPSSILLGLMASGMNGQKFTFHGYLPIKDPPLSQKLKAISKSALLTGATHIFIETPYRNDKLISAIYKNVDHGLFIQIASGMTGLEENIIHSTISGIQHITLGKVPATFFIGRLEKLQ